MRTPFISDAHREAALIAQKTASVKERAEAAAVRAIGRNFAIKGRDGILYKGVIDAVSVKVETYPTPRGTTIRALFSVDMLCGATQFRRNFVVSKIPA